MTEVKGNVKHILSSCHYSLEGLRAAFSEMAIRQELALGVLHFCVLICIDVPLVPMVIVSLEWLLIFIVELLNTAVETVVDLVSPTYHPLAKKAKDICSAAVFCALCGYGVTWGFIIGCNQW